MRMPRGPLENQGRTAVLLRCHIGVWQGQWLCIYCSLCSSSDVCCSTHVCTICQMHCFAFVSLLLINITQIIINKQQNKPCNYINSSQYVKVSPYHCTLVGLTSAIVPNVDDLESLFLNAWTQIWVQVQLG